jgi:hypothetical protein
VSARPETWREEIAWLATCVGFWVAIWFPLWMTAELEVPGQQYADPVIPIFTCSLLFGAPSYLLHKIIWRHR